MNSYSSQYYEVGTSIISILQMKKKNNEAQTGYVTKHQLVSGSWDSNPCSVASVLTITLYYAALRLLILPFSIGNISYKRL